MILWFDLFGIILDIYFLPNNSGNVSLIWMRSFLSFKRIHEDKWVKVLFCCPTVFPDVKANLTWSFDKRFGFLKHLLRSFDKSIYKAS